MARQTTKKRIETPESNTDIFALKAEIDRLNWIIRQKDLTINALQKGNEEISDELSKVRNK